MNKVTYNYQTFESRNNESVLDTLLRNGIDISFSCRNGVCQTCLLRAVSGNLNSASQKGLHPRLIEKQYFMPCKCYPDTNLNIEQRRDSDFISNAVIADRKMLSADVCQIFLEPTVDIYYHAGQFINLFHPDISGGRSYSLASVPHQDYFLELHVKRHELGAMSRHLIDDLKIGDEIEFSRPAGDSFYRPEHQGHNLLLIGSGTGLAPLIGIARDALQSSHEGQIWLYHGATGWEGLYLDGELQKLAYENANFRYVPSILDTFQDTAGNVVDAAFNERNSLENWIVYIAGDPAMTAAAVSAAQNAGVPAEAIHNDPFIDKKKGGETREKLASEAGESNNWQSDEVPYPEPEPEIWKKLDDGKLLRRILDSFYDAVFEDPILSPYFANSTKQRAKEKVYSFYRRLFTGEKVYFGDRPRNAHHWMVISDEIFNYRESLLESFMRLHELDEKSIQQWKAIEETYRKDIVKDKPRGRMVGGIESPASGFGTLTLDIAGMCDICQTEIEPGQEVRYHLRTGEVYCANCSRDH